MTDQSGRHPSAAMPGQPARTDLTLAEQAALTAGIDFWHTASVERLGLQSLRVTDGPAGARGHRWSVGTSASLPCGSALAATWNRELVRRVGRVLGDEARAKGAGVLLGPTVNIHRHPLNGRHFECFSEDPYLTAEIAVAYIEGVQDRGVGACVKHFVCNDQEYERHTISVEVDERTLREIYLPPFEAAVRRAAVWSVMGAYNRLWGTYCCEHPDLLQRLLREEWSFDGVLMSDWFATHSTPAVAAGLDLEMPGPAKFLGSLLVDAVGRGEVSEAAVAQAAERVLRLISRAGAGAAPSPAEPASTVARAAAAEAIVLLSNTDVLPFDPDRVRSIAVIGPLADRLAVQGGGSAEVSPTYVSSPLEAIQRRAGNGVTVTYEPGCELPGPTPTLDYRWVRAGPDGEPGLQVEVFASPEPSGTPAHREILSRSIARWGGSPAPGVPAGHFSARVTGEFLPDRSGTWELGISSAGQAGLVLNDRPLVVNTQPDVYYRQGSTEATARVDLEAGLAYRLVAEFSVDSGIELAGLRIGARPLPQPEAQQRAVQAASKADVALVVVGYDGAWESEGADRPHMDLPGEQDDLVRAVAAANPCTVVVVNTGAPVTMPWADDVAGILQMWFPGMEGGNALADVLFGDVDPSGRLPTTFPRRLDDSPAYPYYPGQNGVVRYQEGLLVGYRHYDKASIEPRFCFGHGLSYTHFEYFNLRVQLRDGPHVHVAVDLANVGARHGVEVVQVYVRDPACSEDQPDRELREFAKVELQAGQTQSVSFDLPPRAFAHWNPRRRAWVVEPGTREIAVGASSRDLRQSARVDLPRT
ncbi:MAG: glycoside hydrolase family 3 C-terminal domain-containing protein [Chloroflexota bacterium]|nr:glycoside hydrolase family 3 C-terminal domain-containing protein [Chloroflexota bacterium]